MKIDIRNLFALGKLEVNQEVIIPKEYYKTTDIIKMDPLKVHGKIFINYDDNIEVNLTVIGTFILPCAVSLEETPHKIKLEVNEVIKENDNNSDITLELLDVLWENTVLEVPIRVINEKAVIKAKSGKGWELEI